MPPCNPSTTTVILIVVVAETMQRNKTKALNTKFMKVSNLGPDIVSILGPIANAFT